jgi:nucleoside-diphosphate-sugar epimerase
MAAKPVTLITGAPGWIGTRLVRTLAGEVPDAPGIDPDGPSRDLRCLVEPEADATRLNGCGNVEIVRGDLRSPGDLAAFVRNAEGATLFHCAGVVHPRRFVRQLFDVNVEGTRNLLVAAEKAGVRRVVVLSSNSPAGNNPRHDHRFDEGAPYRPYMSYGRSKMLMERVVQEVQERGRLETVIVRPTWFYGPDQPERQTTFFTMIRKGVAPIVGGGRNMRSLTYIDNLSRALLLCENCPQANGQTYWIADLRPYSMNEIVDTVERLMEEEFGIQVAHRRLRLPYLTGQVAQIGDAVIQGLGLYSQKIHVMSEMNKTIACSVERAQRELGYAPTVELEEGMRRSLAWCVANGIAF